MYVTGFRYLFCAVSLVMVIIFHYKFTFTEDPNHQVNYEVTFEQKFLKIIGYSLFAFNDPFTLFNLLDPFYFSPIIISVEIGFFVTVVMIFWLTMFERVNRETYSPSTYVMSWWKIGISVILGLMLTLATIFASYNYLDDPTFSVEYTHSKIYTTLSWIANGIVLLCFLYIVS